MSVERSDPRPSPRPFLQILRDDAAATRNSVREHPWVRILRKLKGRVGPDGIERISTNDVFDALEIPTERDNPSVHAHAPPRLDKHPRPRPEPGLLQGSGARLRARSAGAPRDGTAAE
jgi:hypothetical protein